MKNYHNDFTFWSKSFLVNFLKSPLSAKIYMDEEKKDSPAMNFGRAYHMSVEGLNVPVYKFDERPDQRYSMSAKANIAWLEEMKAKHETIISDEEMDKINEMISVLKSNETYQKISSFKPKKEEPFMAEVSGYKLKCKPDAICSNSALIIDWKTIDDVSDNSIYKAIRMYQYDMQAALYCDILKEITGVAHNFLFMFQEKNKPYDVVPVLVRHSSDTYAKGREKYLICCSRAAEAFKTNIWAGAASKFDKGILELD